MEGGRWRWVRDRLDGGVLARALISLALACLLWAWVTNLEDPIVERKFPTVTPAIVGRTSDLVLPDEARLPTVSIDVRGPRSVLTPLPADGLNAQLDLGGITGPGPARLAVTTRLPRGVRLIGITPNPLDIAVDRLVTKSFAIEVEKGAPVPPYSIGAVEPAIRRADVRGPATLVERVARVALPVALGDHRDNFEAQFSPEARDAAGARVTGVSIEPGSVGATVAIERVGRIVSIVANVKGDLPDGYRVTGATVIPSFVTVDGPPEALAQLIVISTAPLDATGRTGPFSVFDVPLALPPGLRLVDRPAVNVQVQIEAEAQRQPIGGLRVTPANLDGGLRATIAPQEIAVTLSGSRERLSQLKITDIRVEVDLRGRDQGTYLITPIVTVPAGLTVVEVPQVRVQIDRAATPAPAPSAAPPSPAPSPTPRPTAPPSPFVTPTPGATRPATPSDSART